MARVLRAAEDKVLSMNSNENYTTILMTYPSFWKGFARVLNLSGRFDCYNTSSSEVEADNDAIERDWIVVGKELKEAFDSR